MVAYGIVRCQHCVARLTRLRDWPYWPYHPHAPQRFRQRVGVLLRRVTFIIRLRQRKLLSARLHEPLQLVFFCSVTLGCHRVAFGKQPFCRYQCYAVRHANLRRPRFTCGDSGLFDAF
jgi:hypothetical protein